MDLDTLRTFLLWCTILNGGLLVVAFLVCSLAGDWVYRMHRRWFPIGRDAFTVAIYAVLGAFKLLVLGLNLVPWLALVIVG